MVDDWADCCDQRRPGVASQRVLEQSRNLRVAVAHMVFVLPLGQALDHLAETAETQVDGLEFQHVLLVHYFFLVNFLAACQIAEV